MSVPARAEILELINEMAARLGRAPGRKLFADETGITESMWVTYWPRWSDALVGAGLTPNELQTAIPDDELLEHLARLVRRLGKWPTFNEIRSVVRSDASYPSFNTLTRLGTKSEMLRRLRGFAEARPEWHDVQALLPEATPTPDTMPDETEPVSAVGYVYLVKSGRHYKIGRTNDVGRRVYEIRLQLPERAQLVHQIETDDPEGIERYWHGRFADRRANGEWFRLTTADVAVFRKRKFM